MADFQLNLHLGRFFSFLITITIKVDQEAHQHGLQNAQPHQGEDRNAVAG